MERRGRLQSSCDEGWIRASRAGRGGEERVARDLERVLRPANLVWVVVGLVIGSGIFIVPATVLRLSGGGLGLALIVWTLAGVVSVMGALTYGELAAMNPAAGGLYVYIRDTFGPFVAFLYGWALFFVMATGAVATLAVAFTSYLGQLVPLGATASRVVAVVLIALVAAINVRGTRQSAGVQGWTTALKVGALLAMSALLLGRGSGLATARLWPESDGSSLLAGLGVAMVGVLWAYEGWQYATFLAGETLDAQRNFPRGMFLGTAVLVGLYLLANVAYVAALRPARAAASERIAAEAVSAVLGPGAGKLIALAILVAMFSTANAITLTSPRVYFAMARDGVFFRRLAEVHPRWGTPAVSIVASSAWAAVLAASGTFEQLLTYVVFTSWAFYALGAASLFHYRWRRPEAARPFRVPGYPWTPLLFLLSAAGIVLSTIFGQPRRAAAGLGIVLLGAPAYLIWRSSGATPKTR
jgi:APA family basic amino acid/polyamine antiporter